MDGKNEIRKISLAAFSQAVVAMRAESWRLVQIMCRYRWMMDMR